MSPKGPSSTPTAGATAGCWRRARCNARRSGRACSTGGEPLDERADALHPDVDHSGASRTGPLDRAARLHRGGPEGTPPAGPRARSRLRRPRCAGQSRGGDRPSDAALYAGLIDPVQAVTHHFRPGFLGYLFVVHGAAQLVAGADGGELDEGGAAKVTGEPQVTIQARDAGAEVLLVETRGVDRSRAA